MKNLTFIFKKQLKKVSFVEIARLALKNKMISKLFLERNADRLDELNADPECRELIKLVIIDGIIT